MQHSILTAVVLLVSCRDGKVLTDPITEDGEFLTDNDGDGYLSDEDCDDSDPTVNPSAQELCDGFDNDCDSQADEGVQQTFYADSDGDGFGSEGITTEACEIPAGYVTNGSDCDDAQPSSHPGADEQCDGEDNNCDGEVDEGLMQTFYLDGDDDGFGDEEQLVEACMASDGITGLAGDCDDADDSVNPLAEEVCDGLDNDCSGETDEDVSSTYHSDFDGDGYGDPEQPTESCDRPEGFVDNAEDCNDLDSQIHPMAEELCDGEDNNCNGLEDDEAVDAQLWFEDGDQDGYGDPDQESAACEPPSGYVADGSDCDDNDDDVSPAAAELCNGLDDDCNGLVDEGEASDAPIWYSDGDGDGYGDEASPLASCDMPGGYSADSTDCNDGDAEASPGAVEQCNGADDDCDGDTDEDAEGETAYYLDADGDGYGSADSPSDFCLLPEGYAEEGLDCDDANPEISPSQPEICDDIDNNCDGQIDEGVEELFTVYYSDADGDGYGDPASTQIDCAPPEGHVLDQTDCNDEEMSVSPEAAELCDGIDNDCDGSIDEGLTDIFYSDSDGDGYGDASVWEEACEASESHVDNSDDCDDQDPNASPTTSETCDGSDNDCDGSIDEELTVIFFYDSDGDGFGEASVWEEACEPPEGHVDNSDDCDDQNGDISPDDSETCDGSDNDCDGQIDEGMTDIFFYDSDGDGFGEISDWEEACEASEGYVDNSGDCDDQAGGISPDGSETCDGVDNDCNGVIDEALTEIFFLDSDLDGYGDVSNWTEACEAPEGHVDNSGDCDDDVYETNPLSDESCDSIDNDCDGSIDEGLLTLYFADGDEDGYGDSSSYAAACETPEDHVENPEDCDDDNNTIHPGAEEVCNEVDDDCDGSVDGDDAVDQETYFLDGDEDGAGDLESTAQACSPPEGYVETDDDCDDGNANLNQQDADGDGVTTCNGDCDDDWDLVVDCLDCAEILELELDHGDGLYDINPDGNGAYSAYCDMTTHGGGWTLVGRQTPTEKFTGTTGDINVDEDWDHDATFRYGNSRIQAFAPEEAWRITSVYASDGSPIDEGWFVPECEIDWGVYMGYQGSVFNPDCGIAYTDSTFSNVVGGSYTEGNCALGIGQNNSGAYCSLRMGSCTWSSASQQGQAVTCNVSDTDSAVISLWVK
jgi:hypothetical protein